MPGFKFDINDGDFIFDMGGNTGMDSEGHIMFGIGNNAMMDSETGDIHFTSGGFVDDLFDEDLNDD